MTERRLLARGMGASPGTASGRIALSAADALTIAGGGDPVILVRVDATTDDVPAIRVSVGVITTHGGITGDAAIVARSLGKPCIAACPTFVIDYRADSVTVQKGSALDDEIVLRRGDLISMNGATGEIWVD